MNNILVIIGDNNSSWLRSLYFDLTKFTRRIMETIVIDDEHYQIAYSSGSYFTFVGRMGKEGLNHYKNLDTFDALIYWLRSLENPVILPINDLPHTNIIPFLEEEFKGRIKIIKAKNGKDNRESVLKVINEYLGI